MNRRIASPIILACLFSLPIANQPTERKPVTLGAALKSDEWAIQKSHTA